MRARPRILLQRCPLLQRCVRVCVQLCGAPTRRTPHARPPPCPPPTPPPARPPGSCLLESCRLCIPDKYQCLLDTDCCSGARRVRGPSCCIAGDGALCVPVNMVSVMRAGRHLLPPPKLLLSLLLLAMLLLDIRPLAPRPATWQARARLDSVSSALLIMRGGAQATATAAMVRGECVHGASHSWGGGAGGGALGRQLPRVPAPPSPPPRGHLMSDPHPRRTRGRLVQGQRVPAVHPRRPV